MRFTLIFGMSLALFQPSASWSQEIRGIVAWNAPSGQRPIPFAEVELCPEDGGACLRSIAGSDGTFSVVDVSPGAYEVRASTSGGQIVRNIFVERGQATVFVELAD
jgi:hypothetical protein